MKGPAGNAYGQDSRSDYWSRQSREFTSMRMTEAFIQSEIQVAAQ